MHRGFWELLAEPIIGLSPMDGVTDQPFRHIQKKYGQPAVVYTEFTSVEGVCHGADRLLTDFLYDETQRPIVAQVYGTTPDYFRQTAVILCQLGFDGIDINMGCPAKNVAHSGAGAALIQTPTLAQDIVRAVKAGIQDFANGQRAADCPDITDSIARQVELRSAALPLEIQKRFTETGFNLPVSIKTRVGYSQPVIGEWVPTLLEVEPATIALHGRTLKQQYGGQASWELIGQAAELTNTTPTALLGNGDIIDLPDALDKIQTYQVNGALIGRASMGNPLVFLEKTPTSPTLAEIALEHTQLFEATYPADTKPNHFLPMRKHLGWYIKNIPNASQIRIELFQTHSSAEVETILRKHGLL